MNIFNHENFSSYSTQNYAWIYGIQTPRYDLRLRVYYGLSAEKGRSGVSLSCVVAHKMMMELHIEHLLECVGVIRTIYYAAVIQEIMTHETSM